MAYGYRGALLPDTFLYQFMEYMDGFETARAYDFWSGVWCLGSAIGRAVNLMRADIALYTNWYIVLTAETGITRKSTAVAQARRVLTQALAELGVNRIMIETKSNGRGIMLAQARHSDLYGHCITHVCVSEMADVFDRGRASASVITMLTDLYDCPDEKASSFVGDNTRLVEVSTRKQVFVSLLTACTPTWLYTRVTRDAVEGGFTGRTLFVPAHQRKKNIPWPDPKGDITNLVSSLVDTTRFAHHLRHITLSEGALAYFKSWYNKRKSFPDLFRQTFAAREHDHVLRLAMTLAVNNRRPEVTRTELKAAIRIMGDARDDAADLFLNHSLPDRITKGIEKVRLALLEAGPGGVKTMALWRPVRRYLSKPLFDTLMSIMQESMLVDKFTPNIVRPGPKTDLWIARRTLADDGHVERLSQLLAPDED